MRKVWILLFFLSGAISAFAQTREDIRIYIPPVIASPNQAAYFEQNFEMETLAAGYVVTRDIRAADYSLRLEVRPNMILYDDGTEEPAPPDEKQFSLDLRLIRIEDNADIVAFSFPFTEMEEMYDYNLYLLYEAMANVPLSRPVDAPALVVAEEIEWWRNKWLYIRASFDYPVITTFVLKPDGLLGTNAIYNPNDPTQYNELDHKVRAVPGGTLGVELQFLNWMSIEFDIMMRFGDPISNTFIPGIGLQLKFPVKPSRHFMLEPYITATSSMDTAENFVQFPWLEAGGGFQFGIKGGNMGAFFIDVNFVYAFDEVITKNNHSVFTEPRNIHWDFYTVGIGIGYKIGFVNRPGKTNN